MAPALRMTRSIKEKLKIFCPFSYYPLVALVDRILTVSTLCNSDASLKYRGWRLWHQSKLIDNLLLILSNRRDLAIKISSSRHVAACWITNFVKVLYNNTNYISFRIYVEWIYFNVTDKLCQPHDSSLLTFLSFEYKLRPIEVILQGRRGKEKWKRGYAEWTYLDIDCAFVSNRRLDDANFLLLMICM